MKNLQDFVDLLEKNDELIRVKDFVSINLQMAEINDRMVKNGGKALLFENNETKFPVLLNMFGSDKRISMALRVGQLEDLTQRIDDLFKDATSPKLTLSDKLKMLPLLKDVSQWLPKNISGKGECQQTIITGTDINLYDLPILKSAPYDAAAFITFPLVNSINPENSSRNVGMYRMQVIDKNTTAMHWHKHKTGEVHYEKYKSISKPMPIAVCLGGDPAYTYSATAPLPEGIDEYILSGFIRRKPVKLVKCITNDLRVPSDCDFVIEGYVDTAEAKIIEGPFGDHTGFYSLQDKYPLFHITCITHRKDAIYPATVVGIPPQEDAYIGKATERIFLSPIKAVMQPEITDMFLPFEGVAHNIAVMNINKRYIGQALKVASGMWGAGQMMFNKFAIVVSEPKAKLTDYNIYKEALRDIDLKESLIFSRGPLDVLDHNAPICGYGGKLCIDLSKRLEGETSVQRKISLPKEISLTEGLTAVDSSLAQKGWSVIFVSAERSNSKLDATIKTFFEKNSIKGINFVIVLDSEHNFKDLSTLVWIAANNIDPVRDSIVEKEYVIFDARSKFEHNSNFSRPWPNIVLQDENTVREIDQKWETLGLGEFIKSPSLKYKHLEFSKSAEVEK